MTSHGGPSCRVVKVADTCTNVHFSKTRTQQAQTATGTASSGKVTNLLPWFLTCESLLSAFGKNELKKCAFTGTISMHPGNSFCFHLFFLASFLQYIRLCFRLLAVLSLRAARCCHASKCAFVLSIVLSRFLKWQCIFRRLFLLFDDVHKF